MNMSHESNQMLETPQNEYTLAKFNDLLLSRYNISKSIPVPKVWNFIAIVKTTKRPLMSAYITGRIR